MSDSDIVTGREAPLPLMVACLLLSPVCLVVYVVLLPWYLLWTAVGVILSVPSGRDWCLIVGELPRTKR